MCQSIFTVKSNITLFYVTLLFTEDEETNDKKKEKAEGESSSEAEKKSKGKQMIKVGAEYIKRVEVQYCELCKVYLPRSENTERAVALHCSTRSHLKRYIIIVQQDKIIGR